MLNYQYYLTRQPPISFAVSGCPFALYMCVNLIIWLAIDNGFIKSMTRSHLCIPTMDGSLCFCGLLMEHGSLNIL
jgi:hypothetical protein